MMRCRMRGHAQQNNLSCRLAGAKKGVRFNVTPPYRQSHRDNIRCDYGGYLIMAPARKNERRCNRNTRLLLYIFIYISLISLI